MISIGYSLFFSGILEYILSILPNQFLTYNKPEIFYYTSFRFVDFNNALLQDNFTKQRPHRTHSAPYLTGKDHYAKQLLFDGIEAKTIAQQLTYIMHDIYANIPFDNFYSGCFSTDYYTETYSQTFNNIVSWVQQTILIAFDSKQRAKIIKKWIHVCEWLLKLNNFHALVAVHCALKSNCVYSEKLKIAWYSHKRIINKKHHNKLKLISDIVSYQRNFRALREKTACSVAPVLPYWGLFKRDCQYANELKNSEDLSNQYIQQYKLYRQGQYTTMNRDKLITTWIYYQLNEASEITLNDLQTMSDNVCKSDQQRPRERRYSLTQK